MASRQEAIDLLIEIVREGGHAAAVVTGAIQGLGHAGGAEARDCLIHVLQSGSFGAGHREAAAAALGEAAKN